VVKKFHDRKNTAKTLYSYVLTESQPIAKYDGLACHVEHEGSNAASLAVDDCLTAIGGCPQDLSKRTLNSIHLFLLSQPSILISEHHVMLDPELPFAHWSPCD
jgi:hypothetical protein